jgi:hypothetical protein
MVYDIFKNNLLWKIIFKNNVNSYIAVRQYNKSKMYAKIQIYKYDSS